MKKILVVSAVAMMVLGMAGGAFAVDLMPKPTIDVTASIAKNCKEISTGVLPLIADIDTSSSTPVDVLASTDEIIKCTMGVTPINVTVTSGNDAADTGLCDTTGITMKMKSPTVTAGTDIIPYKFKCANGPTLTGAGFGAGGSLPLGISVSVIPTDAADATLANNYKDTVTLTIAY